MPNQANTQTLSTFLPKQKGERVKHWRYRLADLFGWSERRIRYYLIDTRSKRLSQSYLREISSQKIQKVRSNITSNHIKRGVAYEDITSSPDNSKGNG